MKKTMRILSMAVVLMTGAATATPAVASAARP